MIPETQGIYFWITFHKVVQEGIQTCTLNKVMFQLNNMVILPRMVQEGLRLRLAKVFLL